MDDSISVLSHSGNSIYSVATEVQYIKTNQHLKMLNSKIEKIGNIGEKFNLLNSDIINKNNILNDKNNILNDKLINCLEELNLKNKINSDLEKKIFILENKINSDLEKKIFILENSSQNLINLTKDIKSENERLRMERNKYRDFYDNYIKSYK